MEKQKIIYISAFLILTSLAGAGIYNLDTGEFDDLNTCDDFSAGVDDEEYRF